MLPGTAAIPSPLWCCAVSLLKEPPAPVAMLEDGRLRRGDPGTGGVNPTGPLLAPVAHQWALRTAGSPPLRFTLVSHPDQIRRHG